MTYPTNIYVPTYDLSPNDNRIWRFVLNGSNISIESLSDPTNYNFSAHKPLDSSDTEIQNNCGIFYSPISEFWEYLEWDKGELFSIRLAYENENAKDFVFVRERLKRFNFELGVWEAATDIILTKPMDSIFPADDLVTEQPSEKSWELLNFLAENIKTTNERQIDYNTKLNEANKNAKARAEKEKEARKYPEKIEAFINNAIEILEKGLVNPTAELQKYVVTSGEIYRKDLDISDGNQKNLGEKRAQQKADLDRHLNTFSSFNHMPGTIEDLTLLIKKLDDSPGFDKEAELEKAKERFLKKQREVKDKIIEEQRNNLEQLLASVEEAVKLVQVSSGSSEQSKTDTQSSSTVSSEVETEPQENTQASSSSSEFQKEPQSNTDSSTASPETQKEPENTQNNLRPSSNSKENKINPDTSKQAIQEDKKQQIMLNISQAMLFAIQSLSGNFLLTNEGLSKKSSALLKTSNDFASNLSSTNLIKDFVIQACTPRKTNYIKFFTSKYAETASAKAFFKALSPEAKKEVLDILDIHLESKSYSKLAEKIRDKYMRSCTTTSQNLTL